VPLSSSSSVLLSSANAGAATSVQQVRISISRKRKVGNTRQGVDALTTLSHLRT
jgi:hypothetical protein